MGDTKIQWATKVWNPVTGCTKISDGCRSCYAERMANRLRGRCGYPADDPFQVTLHPEKLNEPLKWRKPSRIFVCSMGDLFHEDVPTEFIWQIFSVMLEARHHTFIVLTKRSERMKMILNEMVISSGKELPENVIGMVTVEKQEYENRIVDLLETPFKWRGLSIEPMLEAVDLLNDDYLGGCIYCETCLEESPKTCIERDAKIDWVICGGESGPNARPMHPDWVRSLREQCQAAGVPYFFKQWGEWVHESQAPDILENYNPEFFFDRVNSKGFARVGKKIARDLLDGKQYHEFPEATK